MKEKQAIYRAVRSLTKRFGETFTPAGVLVGALGEVLAEEKYDLELLPPKAQPFEAVDSLGRNVLIRCNQRNSTSIKKAAPWQMLLVLKLLPDGTIEEVFNGAALVAYQSTGGRKKSASGFVSVSHRKLRKLMESVPKSKRIAMRRRPAI